jgi:ferrous iron transport protein B
MSNKSIYLVGNPNSGKSSLFNLLTGLNQQVSNFPGVTVERKKGRITLTNSQKVDIIDLPGCYSLYPNSSEEKIIVEILTNFRSTEEIGLVVYVLDVNQLERHLLLASQIHDLGLKMVVILNMSDIFDAKGHKIDISKVESFLSCPILSFSTKTAANLSTIQSEIEKVYLSELTTLSSPLYQLSPLEKKATDYIQTVLPIKNAYQAKIIGHHASWLPFITASERISIASSLDVIGFENIRMQINETLTRFSGIQPMSDSALGNSYKFIKDTRTDNIDQIITHKIFGPLIFFGIMFFIFQAIYSWAQWPMDQIESLFSNAGGWVRYALGQGMLSDLIVDGIIAGLGGVLVFVPQIFILFLLIAILEESGYMSRAVYMFDGVMQRVGLNGRSIVALISSGACAIPAIMSTRTISNRKERLITIMVSPLISCSARLPVYALLVGFVVPSYTVGGMFNSQGLVFMGLYLMGIIAAMVVAYVMKLIMKSDESSHLIIELPQYKAPMVKNIFISVKEKVGSFIFNAGKTIMVISIVLWFLASFGPSEAMKNAETNAEIQAKEKGLDQSEQDNLAASFKLESSYAGIVGKAIEPVIAPLGFDWKIGIALITSFAAREVFVGTMATIYSVGSEDDELSIREKLEAEIRPGTNEKLYSLATALSLLIFYVFAMQCMSTLAVTKKETGSWKWPIIQFTYMTALAYVGSLICFQLLG